MTRVPPKTLEFSSGFHERCVKGPSSKRRGYENPLLQGFFGNPQNLWQILFLKSGRLKNLAVILDRGSWFLYGFLSLFACAHHVFMPLISNLEELHQLSGKPFGLSEPQMSTHAWSSNIFLTFPITIIKPLSYWFCTKKQLMDSKVASTNQLLPPNFCLEKKSINRSQMIFHRCANPKLRCQSWV